VIVRTVKMTEYTYEMLRNAVAHLEYMDRDSDDDAPMFTKEIDTLNGLLKRWEDAP